MISVWVLVFWMSAGHAGGPAVIDNIASQQECARIQSLVREIREFGATSRCIEVRKVK